MKTSWTLYSAAALAMSACATQPVQSNAAAPVAAAAATATADSSDAKAIEVAAIADGAEEKHICKSTQVTGSKFKKKISATQSE